MDAGSFFCLLMIVLILMVIIAQSGKHKSTPPSIPSTAVLPPKSVRGRGGRNLSYLNSRSMHTERADLTNLIIDCAVCGHPLTFTGKTLSGAARYECLIRRCRGSTRKYKRTLFGHGVRRV